MPADNHPFLQVRDFYLTRYRPLYDHFVTNGEVPQELHAEIAAAFDHLFRIAPDGEASLREKEPLKVVAHVKRATFDAFKMMFKREIREPYDRLHTLTYADVDNGKFLPDVEKESTMTPSSSSVWMSAPWVTAPKGAANFQEHVITMFLRVGASLASVTV